MSMFLAVQLRAGPPQPDLPAQVRQGVQRGHDVGLAGRIDVPRTLLDLGVLKENLWETHQQKRIDDRDARLRNRGRGARHGPAHCCRLMTGPWGVAQVQPPTSDTTFLPFEKGGGGWGPGYPNIRTSKTIPSSHTCGGVLRERWPQPQAPDRVHERDSGRWQHLVPTSRGLQDSTSCQAIDTGGGGTPNFWCLVYSCGDHSPGDAQRIRRKIFWGRPAFNWRGGGGSIEPPG